MGYLFGQAQPTGDLFYTPTLQATGIGLLVMHTPASG